VEIFGGRVSRSGEISLAPGFSPVLDRREQDSRFNGFAAIPEAAEAAGTSQSPRITGLKAGADQSKPAQPILKLGAHFDILFRGVLRLCGQRS
jgi:hypothetical protein